MGSRRRRALPLARPARVGAQRPQPRSPARGPRSARARRPPPASGATSERVARLARVLEDDRARPDTPVEGLDGPVAFVCAEFGIHPSLPIYSGGLGALAGDILKQASDLALPVVGVGLLYRKGYFQQRVDRTGLQHEYWTQIVPEHLPTVQVAGGRRGAAPPDVPALRARGRVPRLARRGRPRPALPPRHRARRERPRRPVDHRPPLRGQPAHAPRPVRAARDRRRARAPRARDRARRAALQRGASGARGARARRRRRRRGSHARRRARAARERCVFTTHTPVPAGNEAYEPESLRDAFADLPARLGIDAERFLDLCRTRPALGRVARDDAARACGSRGGRTP